MSFFDPKISTENLLSNEEKDKKESISTDSCNVQFNIESTNETISTSSNKPDEDKSKPSSNDNI